MSGASLATYMVMGGVGMTCRVGGRSVSRLGLVSVAKDHSATSLAASFPDNMAPSILARYFCLEKPPAQKKLAMGDFCVGRAASVPGVVSSTDVGVLTQVNLFTLAKLPSVLTSLGKCCSNSSNVAAEISSSDLVLYLAADAKTSGNMDRSSSA